MSRPAPRITPGAIAAMAIIDPSGRHLLEVAVPSGIVAMLFDAGQVGQLKAAIAQFEAQANRADGGPDFFHRKSIPLEVPQ